MGMENGISGKGVFKENPFRQVLLVLQVVLYILNVYYSCLKFESKLLEFQINEKLNGDQENCSGIHLMFFLHVLKLQLNHHIFVSNNNYFQ